MAIGDDLAAVFEDVGLRINIYKYSDDSTTEEYVDFRLHTDSEYLLKDEFMSECSFKYSTVVEEGDLLTTTINDRKYIILAMNDEVFENTIIVKEGILYRCNVVVTIERSIGEVRNDDYELVPDWQAVKTGVYGLIAGSSYDKSIVDKKYSSFEAGNDVLFISKSIDIRANDRIQVTSNLNTAYGSPPDQVTYQVQMVEDYRMPGVFVCQLIQDVRE